MDERVRCGADIITNFLEGGYEKDAITTIYGPAGSGKTNLAILAAVEMAKNGKKVIFIDTEGGFSFIRLKQITSEHDYVMENIIFLQPTSFEEQKKDFEKLQELVNDSIGLIIVDTIAMLYRLERSNNEIHEVNRALGMQISRLSSIARKKKIPVLITNQVYSLFDVKNAVNMVGGDILKYGSKCLIELQTCPEGVRKAILRKHRSIIGEKEILFRIIEKGIEPIPL